MSSGVFVLQKDGTLVEMTQQEYDSEDIFQELLVNYPNLLAGGLIDEINPRKWILISREFSIPNEETSLGRWSLDHLFLDQDGVPTLVEVKRSSDTRIRREVVGQMLEYAANAVSYWDIDRIRLVFETRCENNGLNPEQEWTNRLQSKIGYDDYWLQVDTNLKTGKIRMMFIADVIPMELKQIVEFLNEQMNPAEVLALEIKQYVGEDQKTLIPRLYGQTTKTQIMKDPSRKRKQWDESSFLAELLRREDQSAVDTARYIITWSKNNELTQWYGKGNRSGSFIPFYRYKNLGFWLFALWTYGGIELQFQHMKKQEFLNDVESRTRLLEKLNTIPSVELPVDSVERRPSIPFSALETESSLHLFLSIWDDYLNEIRKFIQK